MTNRLRNSRPLEWVVLPLLVGLGWCFWLQRLGINDLGDGASNEVIFAREPLTTILFDMLWPDQSPLYFVLLHIWKVFGESPFAVRSLNVLILSFSVVAVYRLARALCRSATVSAASALLAAISPLSLWLIRDGRMYTLVLLFSVLSLKQVVLYRQDRKARYALLFGLFCTLNIYTHFVGFLMTAILTAFWLLETGLETRRGRLESTARSPTRRLYLVPALAAGGIVVMTLPQIVRLFRLIGQAPTPGVLSMPALSHYFLLKLSWFGFVNSRWGVPAGEPTLYTAYRVGIILLVVLGILSTKDLRHLIFWLAGTIGLLGLLGAHLDLRDRYFTFGIPVLWIAIAAGAFGQLPERLRRTRLGEPPFALRWVAFAVVVAGSVWLSANKRDEQFPEWSKLMTGLQELYRPSMSIYMPPGPFPGIPALVAAQHGLDPALRELQPLHPSTRSRFAEEMSTGREFVFLVHGEFRNAEMSSRSRWLSGAGYRKTVIRVWGASAELFTRGELPGVVRADKLGSSPSPTQIVAWARQRLAERQGAAHPARLAGALAARIRPDGEARESVFFLSQRGESAYWKLGEPYWDSVHEAATTSAGVAKKLFYAHPADDSLLVVTFPEVLALRSLTITHGIADSGLHYERGASVGLEIYLGSNRLADLTSPNSPGWRVVRIDTAAYEGERLALSFLISSENEKFRHFYFGFETSWRSGSAG